MGRWEKIPAIVYPKHMPDTLCLRYELTENVARSELTEQQKQKNAAELAELKANGRSTDERENKSANRAIGTKSAICANGTKTTKSKPGRSPGWFTQWIKDSETHRRTANNWWAEFCAGSTACGQGRRRSRHEDRER